MNLVESILLENIDNPSSVFVVPTDIAVSRWVDRLLVLRRGGTVAMERFIAWDKFKQNSVKSRVHDKQSIPSVLRYHQPLVAINLGSKQVPFRPSSERKIEAEWRLFWCLPLLGENWA